MKMRRKPKCKQNLKEMRPQDQLDSRMQKHKR